MFKQINRIEKCDYKLQCKILYFIKYLCSEEVILHNYVLCRVFRISVFSGTLSV